MLNINSQQPLWDMERRYLDFKRTGFMALFRHAAEVSAAVRIQLLLARPWLRRREEEAKALVLKAAKTLCS